MWRRSYPCWNRRQTNPSAQQPPPAKNSIPCANLQEKYIMFVYVPIISMIFHAFSIYMSIYSEFSTKQYPFYTSPQPLSAPGKALWVPAVPRVSRWWPTSSPGAVALGLLGVDIPREINRAPGFQDLKLSASILSYLGKGYRGYPMFQYVCQHIWSACSSMMLNVTRCDTPVGRLCDEWPSVHSVTPELPPGTGLSLDNRTVHHAIPVMDEPVI